MCGYCCPCNSNASSASFRASSFHELKSDYTAYMYLGELIEYDVTDTIFIKPKRTQTEDYITGRFG